MPDMLLTLCLTVTMVSWSLVLVDRTSRPQRTLFVGYVAMAFGVLSKGPVAIVLPAMAVLLHTAWTRRLDSVRRLRPMLGGLVVLGIVSPYFIRVAVSAGTGPIENFFLHENIRRFTGTAFSTSTVPFVYEMSALLGDFFPWTPAVVLAAWAWLGYRQVPEAHRRVAALFAVWVLAPLVFFIVSRFKLDYYFLPAMPPAAVLTAYALTSPALLTRGVRRVAVVTAGAIMVLAVLTGIAAGKMIEVNFAETAGRWVPHVVASLGAIAATALAWRYGIRAAALGFAGTIWATTVSGYLVLLEDYSRFHASAQVARLFRPDTTVLISERASPWGSDLALYAPGATGMRELLQPAPLGTVTREGAREPAVMAVIDDRDYADIAQQAGMPPRILAEWPAYRANKLTLRSLLHPAYGRLYVIEVPAHRAREPAPGVRAEPG
jgi:4-amino-4-deoxy-L-arabinose transferase-like glycosyltransferase